MISTRDKAAGIKRIQADPVFDIIINEIRQDQIDVFTSRASSSEQIEAAHNLIVAIDVILGKFNAVLAAERLEDKRNNK